MRFPRLAPTLRLTAFLLVAGFLGASGLGFSPVAASDATQSTSGPAIWKISNDKAKGQVYLFGSVHMLKKDVVWFTPKIENAFKSANDLTIETNINPAGVDEIKAFIQREAVYPAGDSLKNHIAPALFEETAALGQKAGIPPAALERLKPWYAATLLSLTFIQADGYSAQSGVEVTLQAAANAKSMPVAGLETISQQMQTLSGGTPKVQEAMLADAVRELKDMRKMMDDMNSAWISGDEAKLVKNLIEPMNDVPEAYQAIVVDRNRNWIPKIRALMDKPGVHFVVVGAAHLVGPDGVVKMLKGQGIKVERY
jgi:uncharacterized protein YbaP (TraB family)